MEFGFSLNAFQRHGLEESLKTLGDLGYDGVEILLDEPHLFPGTADEDDVAAVRDLLDANGLSVNNCNAFMLKALEPTAESEAAEYDRDTEAFHHPSFLEPAAEDRRARVEHTTNALETADALGADSISLTPGGPIPKGTSEEDAMALFLEGIREVMPTAEDVGVDVLVEPEPELLIETSDDFLAFVDQIDSPRIGCNFDAGHFVCVDEDPVELIDELSSHTGHYHLEDIPADKTHEHTQLGDGDMDIDGFLRALDDGGYDGFVTVELYPYEETPHETASNAMDYLEAHGWA